MFTLIGLAAVFLVAERDIPPRMPSAKQVKAALNERAEDELTRHLQQFTPGSAVGHIIPSAGGDEPSLQTRIRRRSRSVRLRRSSGLDCSSKRCNARSRGRRLARSRGITFDVRAGSCPRSAEY